MIKKYNKKLCKGFALITCSVITVTFIGLMVVGLQSLNSAKSSYISEEDITAIRNYRKSYASAFTRYLTKVCNSKLSRGDSKIKNSDLNDALDYTNAFMEQHFSGFVTGNYIDNENRYDSELKGELDSNSNSESYAEAFFSTIHGSINGNVDLNNLEILNFRSPNINEGSPGLNSPLALLSSGHPCSKLKGKRLCVILRVAGTLEGRKWDYSEFQISFFQIPMSQFSRATNGDLNLNSTVDKSYSYKESNFFAGGSLNGDLNSLEASGLLNGSGKAFVKGDIPIAIEELIDEVENENYYASFVGSDDSYDESDSSSGSDDSYDESDSSSGSDDYDYYSYNSYKNNNYKNNILRGRNKKISKKVINSRKILKGESNVNVVSGSVLKRREFLFGTKEMKSVSDWTPPPWSWRNKSEGSIEGIDFGSPNHYWFKWRLEDHLFVSQNNLGLNSNSVLEPLENSSLGINPQELAYRDFSYGRSLSAKADWLFKFVYSDSRVDGYYSAIVEEITVNPGYEEIPYDSSLGISILLDRPVIGFTGPFGGSTEILTVREAAERLGIDSTRIESSSVSVYGFQKTDNGYVLNYNSEIGNGDNPVFSNFLLLPANNGINTFDNDIVMIDIDLDEAIHQDLQSDDNSEMSWYLRGVYDSFTQLSTVTIDSNDSERSYHVIFRITGDSFGDSSLSTNNLDTLKNISLSFSNPVVLSDFNSTVPHDSVTLSVPHNSINGQMTPEIYMSLSRGAGATTSFYGAVYADNFIPRSYFEYNGSREYEKFNVEYVNPKGVSKMTNWRRFSLVDYGSSYTKMY